MNRFPLLLMLALAPLAPLGAALPLSEPPQPLRDADGNPETGLVDPFTPRSGDAGDPDLAGTGLVRTALGDLPAGFRILAIAVPEDDGAAPSALIRMSEEDEPTLVREGDQVRVLRDGGRKQAASRTAAASEDRYTFYLYVKTIAPTYLEIYHAKNRPDETLILRW